MQHIFQAFNSLSAEDDPATTRALEEVVFQDFPRQYRLSSHKKVIFKPEQGLTEQEKGLIDELVQHLIDLDYLPRRFYTEYFNIETSILSRRQYGQIQQGLLAFCKEDEWTQRTGLFKHAAWTQPPDITKENLPILVQRLNQLTSFDGDLQLERNLILGERSPYSRSLIYRLRCLGQYADNEKWPQSLDRSAMIRSFQVQIKLGLKKKEEIDFEAKELSRDLFNLLADVDTLFRHYHLRNRNGLLFYQLSDSEPIPRAHSRYLISWKSRFHYAQDEETFKRVIQNRTSLNFGRLKILLAERGEASTLIYTGQNQFGTRLLQLKLWMIGFYYGELDGWWGPLSHQALLDFLEQEKRLRHHKRFLIPVEDGFWAINMDRLGGLLSRYDAKAVREEDFIERIPADQESILSEQFFQKENGVRRYYRESRKQQRRIYHGIRSLVACVLRGLTKVWDWVAGKVRKVIGAIVSFFKIAAKRIWEGMLSVTQAFRRFIHFILRKPITTPELLKKAPATSPFVMTRFAIDSDAVNLYSSSVDSSQMTLHLNLIRHLTQGLSLLLTIANEIVKLMLHLSRLRSPIGWIRLGLWIGRKVAQTVRSFQGSAHKLS